MVTLAVFRSDSAGGIERISFGDLVGNSVHTPCFRFLERKFVYGNRDVILENDGDPMNYAFMVCVSDDGDPGFNSGEPTGHRIIGRVQLHNLE